MSSSVPPQQNGGSLQKAVVFTLDASNSMNGNDRNRLAIDSIAQLIYSLSSNYVVGVAAHTYGLDGTHRAVTHNPIRQEYAYDLDKTLTGLTVRSGDALLSQVGYAHDGSHIRKQGHEMACSTQN